MELFYKQHGSRYMVFALGLLFQFPFSAVAQKCTLADSLLLPIVSSGITHPYLLKIQDSTVYLLTDESPTKFQTNLPFKKDLVLFEAKKRKL